MEEEKILKEIKDIVEKFRERGFNVKTEIGNVIVRIFISYKNYEKQKEIIREFSKEFKKRHKLRTKRIKRMYEYYVKKLLKEEIDVLVHYAEGYNVEDDLIKIKQFLEKIYNKYDENYYIKVFRERLKEKFNEVVVKEIKRLMEREKKQYEIFKKYLQFLNKEIDYNKEIGEIEGLLNVAYYRKNYDDDIYKLAIFIERKIKDMIKEDNILFFRIDRGILFIMVYKDENNDKGYTIYKNNRFYLVDLRNNRVMDVSKIIENRYGNKILKKLEDDYNLWFKLHNMVIYDLLV